MNHNQRLARFSSTQDALTTSTGSLERPRLATAEEICDRWIARFDVDGDGEISREEFHSMAKQINFGGVVADVQTLMLQPLHQIRAVVQAQFEQPRLQPHQLGKEPAVGRPGTSRGQSVQGLRVRARIEHNSPTNRRWLAGTVVAINADGTYAVRVAKRNPERGQFVETKTRVAIGDEPGCIRPLRGRVHP